MILTNMDTAPTLSPLPTPPSSTSRPIIAAVPGKKRKKSRKVVYFILGGAVVLFVVVAVALHGRKPPISVQTENISRHNITEMVVASGKIQPVTQVTISPEVAGEIIALPVKEGDQVKKGDLLLRIKPANYQAARDSSAASYQSAIANKNLAQAQLEKAEAEYKRNVELFHQKLVSESVFQDVKTSYEVAKLQLETATHQVDQSKFGLDNATADLNKTTIYSPIDGTVVNLSSQLGERVLGTSFNKGTEIMTIADLSEMEARVDVGEMDVVLMKPGQCAHLEVDAFKDRNFNSSYSGTNATQIEEDAIKDGKFNGFVTEVANAAKGFGQSGAGSLSSSSAGGDATKFEVHIRIKEKEMFRPGMSVTAEIETRSRTNVLAVPIASVTARLPKTNSVTSAANSPASNNVATATNSLSGTNTMRADKKKEGPKQIDVVFVVEGDHVKMVPVKIGISDDNYWEVTEGLQDGQEVVSGGFHAISHDLEDGKKIVKGKGAADTEKKQL
jgi:HlyD family secretion protein